MLPKVVIHNAVSLDGRIDGFNADIGLFYKLAGCWNEGATLAGSDTILAAPGEHAALRQANYSSPAGKSPATRRTAIWRRTWLRSIGCTSWRRARSIRGTGRSSLDGGAKLAEYVAHRAEREAAGARRARGGPRTVGSWSSRDLRRVPVDVHRSPPGR